MAAAAEQMEATQAENDAQPQMNRPQLEHSDSTHTGMHAFTSLRPLIVSSPPSSSPSPAPFSQLSSTAGTPSGTGLSATQLLSPLQTGRFSVNIASERSSAAETPTPSPLHRGCPSATGAAALPGTIEAAPSEPSSAVLRETQRVVDGLLDAHLTASDQTIEAESGADATVESEPFAQTSPVQSASVVSDPALSATAPVSLIDAVPAAMPDSAVAASASFPLSAPTADHLTSTLDAAAEDTGLATAAANTIDPVTRAETPVSSAPAHSPPLVASAEATIEPATSSDHIAPSESAASSTVAAPVIAAEPAQVLAAPQDGGLASFTQQLVQSIAETQEVQLFQASAEAENEAAPLSSLPASAATSDVCTESSPPPPLRSETPPRPTNLAHPYLAPRNLLSTAPVISAFDDGSLPPQYRSHSTTVYPFPTMPFLVHPPTLQNAWDSFPCVTPLTREVPSATLSAQLAPDWKERVPTFARERGEKQGSLAEEARPSAGFRPPPKWGGEDMQEYEPQCEGDRGVGDSSAVWAVHKAPGAVSSDVWTQAHTKPGRHEILLTGPEQTPDPLCTPMHPFLHAANKGNTHYPSLQPHAPWVEPPAPCHCLFEPLPDAHTWSGAPAINHRRR